jgi:hypothetical protein
VPTLFLEEPPCWVRKLDDVVEPGELGWIESERTELALDPTPDDVPDSC